MNRRVSHRELSELTLDERDDYEERAAILEYHGGMSRHAAEWLALHIVTRKKGEKNGDG